MPKATLTSRVLKNKDTGLEIQVPNYNVHKDLLSTVVHYQVVLASNLTCFKSPSHKESDVVQYSVERKFKEFEDLKDKLTGQFPGTMLPPLNKKSIIVNEMVLRERRASLDHFMKCIASVPKMSTCVPLLVFLGVDRLRAKKFNKGEPLDNKLTTAAADNHRDIGNGDQNERESTNPDVFEEDEDSGNEDLFGEGGDNDKLDGLFGVDQGDEAQRPGNIKIFEGQDLKPDLTEDDEKDFSSFIPDAILTKTQKVRTREDEEDNSELLQIEDDLDKLMFVKTEPKKTPETAATPVSTPQAPQPAKPSPLTKPFIPSRPKPQIARKPNNLTTTSNTSSLSSGKPKIPSKTKPSSSSPSDSLPSKSTSSKQNPSALVSPSSSMSAPAGPTGDAAGPTSDADIGTVDSLDQDDIMKYLQDNLDANAEEVDLFS